MISRLRKCCYLVLFAFANFSLNAQNLITNGDFESGGAGTGFQTNYFLVGSNSTPRSYAIVSNAGPINAAFSNACRDHTTATGNMMVVDGANSGAGNDKVWEALTSTGGGGGIPVTVGVTYTFSYWLQSISTTNNAGNSANIQVKINNVDINPTFGSNICSTTLCGWNEVRYTWTATSGFAQIWLFDRQTSSVGNDFALDDISFRAAPAPLSLTYSITNLTCINANDGTIFGYGIGGSGVYTNYTLSGPIPPLNSTTGFFTGLPPGNYTLTVTDNTGASFPQPGIIIPNPAGLTLTAASPTICIGGSTTLTASGGGPYTWSVVPGTEVVPTGANPTVSPSVNATYTVNSTTVTPNNLIYNGDFFLGNVGFTTDYTYYNPNNPTFAQRAYGIVTNPNSWEPGFASCGDRGTGSGRMMVIDGSTSNGGNDKFWCQTVPVTPGQNYNFSYWAQTLALPSPAIIDVVINGVSLGTNAAPAVLCSTTATPWIQTNYSWNSGVSTTAEICLYNRNTASAGNDFAIDDLVLSRINTCVLPPQSVTVTVTNNINLVITNPPAVCLPGTVDITAAAVTAGSTAGLTLTYWSDAAATNPITLAAAAAISVSGTYYIRGTSGTCSVIRPVVVTLTPAGSVAPPTATSPVYFCQGSIASPLVATPLPGGTLNWYGTNATGGTASSTAPTPSTATNGLTVYYVSQTIGTCESPRRAINVNVNSVSGSLNLRCDSTQVSTNPVTSVFFDWDNINPPGPPITYNYAYSINGGPLINASGVASSFEVLGVLPGQSVTLTLLSAPGYPCVTFPISNTCSNCSSTTTPTFTLPNAICIGSTAPTLPTVSNNGISGTWAPSTVSNTASATYIFTPDPILFPCAVQVNKLINVTNPPITVLAGQNICVGSSTTFTSSTPGGTWSSGNTAIATVNATNGQVTGVSSGVVSIDYTFPAAGGCPPVVFSRPVTITNPPVAGTLAGTQAICVGDTSSLNSTVLGGTWTSSNNAVATVNSTTGLVTAVSAGSAIMTYTVSGIGGCPNATATRTITVTAVPTAGTLSGTQSVCVGLSTSFSSTVVGGTWSSSSPAIATISSTGVIIGVSAGTATISYVVSGTGGCPASAPATRTVTVSAPQNPGLLSGIQSICVGGTSTFASTVPGGSWSSSNVAIATINASTGAISGIAAGSANIRYEITGTGGCPSTSVTRPINVNANVLPTFTAIAPICSGNPVAPLPLISNNGISGTWNAPIDNTTTATYTFTPSAGQCATTAQLTVTVNQRATPLFSLIGPLCQGQIAPPLLNASENTPPITGTWSPASISTAALGTTIYTFTPTAGQCVTALPTTLAVSILPVVTPNFAPIAPFCDGFPAPILTDTSPNGIVGTWNPPFISNFISLDYTFTPNDGQCALTQTLNVNILPRTIPDFATVNPFCKNSVAPVLPLTSLNGIPGTWNPAVVDNTVSGVFSYVFTPAATECATTQTVFVEVTEPINPGFPDLAFCNGAFVPPLPTISPNAIAGSWTPSAIDNLVSASYLFTPDTGECAVPQTINVTINQYTLVGVTGIVTNYFEDNQVITVLATDAGNYLYQLDYGPFQESNIFQEVSSGTHTITVVDANGCSSPLTAEVMVVNYPKFFTPNGDSYNDTWNIFGLAEQFNSVISIFDRYGKLLKQISPRGLGWDGTYNGQSMPADDYWFVVEYQENGSSKEFKAHFSLKR